MKLIKKIEKRSAIPEAEYTVVQIEEEIIQTFKPYETSRAHLDKDKQHEISAISNRS